MKRATFERFCEGVALQLGGSEPTAHRLRAIGNELSKLGAEIDAAAIAGLTAASGQERLHTIA